VAARARATIYSALSRWSFFTLGFSAEPHAVTRTALETQKAESAKSARSARRRRLSFGMGTSSLGRVLLGRRGWRPLGRIGFTKPRVLYDEWRQPFAEQLGFRARRFAA
jgi:hypothetical protein